MKPKISGHAPETSPTSPAALMVAGYPTLISRITTCTAAIALAVLLSACATRVPIETSEPDRAEDSDLVSVLFFSNRDLEGDSGSARYYGRGRGEPSWGRCQVQPDGRSDINRRVESVTQLEEADVLTHLAAEPRVVLYIHGYNIGFEKGCGRAGRLSRSLGLEDRLLLLSWPADGQYLNYLRDVADLEWSVADMTALLNTLVEKVGAQRLDLIGHSLGARGLVAALKAMKVNDRSRFATLTLVAPDIDRDLFRRDLEFVASAAEQVTVYASNGDRALAVSRRANGYPRAGQMAPDLHYPGVDLVDISPTEPRGVSGHVYHLRTSAVVADLRVLLGLTDDHTVSQRLPVKGGFQLQPVTAP